MLLFFRFFISATISFLFLSGTSLFAAVGFQNYIPAAKIFLTGSNTQVHFDVAGVLFDSGSSVSAPFLDTTTKTFSGTFYLSGAGWVLMGTGTYNTKLDCGAQSLSSLVSNCTLSGTAWSETIGDVIFDRRVQYNPAIGTLSGKVATYIGDISLNGVDLPLLRATFSGSSYTGMADHQTHLSIAHPEIYESTGGLWTSTFTPMGIPVLTHMYSGSGFVADLSLAYQYNLEIVDPNGSKTQYIYDIKNNLPATTLVAGGVIQSFCASAAADTRCPLAPMSFEYTVGGAPNNINVADGQSYVDAHMKFRDRYGNQIVGGNVNIAYETPTKLVQASLVDTSHFGFSPDGDAIINSGTTVLINWLDGTSSTPLPISLIAGQDINYSFASYAPGKIKLKSLKYNGIDAGIVSPEVEFTSWYVADSLSASDIRIGKEATFTGVVSNKSSRTDISPMILHGISIGVGAYATFMDFVSSPMPDCQANQKHMSSYSNGNACEWSSMDGKNFPAIYARTLVPAGETYSFTGLYSPIINLPYIPPEPVVASDYISYVADGRTVLYPTTPFSLGTSTFQNLRIRVLGQSQETSWYNGIAGVRQTKAEFLNTVRKSVTLLSRNRTNYSQADYLYSTTAQNIGASTFDTKRSIIVEGDDVSINTNIDSHGKSLTIIALKDKNGNGGNIHIAPSVTDIHATLIAENTIDSSGDNQLYIHGSIISNNTLGGASKSPVECPYFVTTCTLAKAKLYDFEYFRDSYLLLADPTGHRATSSTAQKYPDTSLIIEYDSRVQQDPPPGLKQ